MKSCDSFWILPADLMVNLALACMSYVSAVVREGARHCLICIRSVYRRPLEEPRVVFDCSLACDEGRPACTQSRASRGLQATGRALVSHIRSRTDSPLQLGNLVQHLSSEGSSLGGLRFLSKDTRRLAAGLKAASKARTCYGNCARLWSRSNLGRSFTGHLKRHSGPPCAQVGTACRCSKKPC